MSPNKKIIWNQRKALKKLLVANGYKATMDSLLGIKSVEVNILDNLQVAFCLAPNRFENMEPIYFVERPEWHMYVFSKHIGGRNTVKTFHSHQWVLVEIERTIEEHNKLSKINQQNHVTLR